MNPIRNHQKKGKNNWELKGGKATLPPEGGKVALPPSNKGKQEIFSDEKGCKLIQNGINYILNHPVITLHSIPNFSVVFRDSGKL